MENKWRIAVASLDGKVINEHFGRAKEFYIVDINRDGTYAFIEKRAIDPLCHSGEHAEAALEATVNALHDCVAVLVSRIGVAAKRTLELNKIAVFEQPDYIESALSKLAAYFIKTNFIKPED